MSETDNGGPAFPRAAGDYNGTRNGNVGQTGMTLRDYFAAKVMQSVWCNNDLLVRAPKGEEADWISAIAYEQADAMLKERAK